MSGTTPLGGVVVVEIGHSVAAPYAGLILADLGARVIKVENPSGGDYARGWGPPFWEGTASVFHSLNRGKEGITVDLSKPDQVASLRKLILDEADVVIQNLRPGLLAKHGLDAASLRAEKSDLVYSDIGAFGAEGPMSSKPGYDPLVQAFSGIMSVTGEGGRPPVRVGVSMVDMGSGMWSVIGILAALLARADRRGGAHVATSLYETGLAWMTVHLAGYAASGEVRRPHGSGLAEIVPYQAFSTRDGWLMVAAGNDGLFRKLCLAIDRRDLADDPDFATNALRVVNRGRLVPELERHMAEMPLDALAAALDAAGVPCAPIQTVDQVMAHPQTRGLGMFKETAGLELAGLPVTLDGTRPRADGEAPGLGRDTRATLSGETVDAQ
ncbi:CoA transferase [Skermanella mucosa]|uniref:CaiB/BaiF CoA transferase family protein n=1 Tax=Skermanella mucosa TaxID=1789672 RepID=UPI00192C9E11|nr:CoA transferase [Skermanella mucosa]UEM19201.1 CoA transferase [Skermanella mucosa]